MIQLLSLQQFTLIFPSLSHFSYPFSTITPFPPYSHHQHDDLPHHVYQPTRSLIRLDGTILQPLNPLCEYVITIVSLTLSKTGF